MAQPREGDPEPFAVHVGERALQRSSKGSITGPLFVVVGGHAFPEQGWSDFPLVVLEWWVRGLLALQTGAPTTFMFMDGPFEYELIRSSATAWGIRLLERRSGGSAKVTFAGSVPPRHVLLGVRRAAEAVLVACKSRNWSSRDVEALQAACDVLDASMPPDATALSDLEQRFAATSPLVAATVAAEYTEWSPEMPPPTIVMGRVGAALVERSAEFNDEALRAIFAVVEDVLTTGTGSDKDIVATGLLEAVLHAGDRLPTPLKRAMAFAGPEARGYCKAWNEFSGAKTEW